MRTNELETLNDQLQEDNFSGGQESINSFCNDNETQGRAVEFFNTASLHGVNLLKDKNNSNCFECEDISANVTAIRNAVCRIGYNAMDAFGDIMRNACDLVQNTSTTPPVNGTDTEDNEGVLLMDAQVDLSSFTPDNWNEIDFNSLRLDSEASDLWVVLKVNHHRGMGSIGCDAGPSIGFADYFNNNLSGELTTYREYTNNSTSVNWNIRVLLNN